MKAEHVQYTRRMQRQFKGRREDARLLTGQGRFAADWNLPGQLYAHFLRSDRAHAEIVSLNIEKATAALPALTSLSNS